GSPSGRRLETFTQCGDERSMPAEPREADPLRAAERPVGSEGLCDAIDEPVDRQWLDPVLPPQADDPQDAGLAIELRFDAPDQLVAEQDREHVIAPPALPLGNIDLPDVVEIEQAPEEVAIPHQGIQRRQEGRSRRLPVWVQPMRDFACRLVE